MKRPTLETLDELQAAWEAFRGEFTIGPRGRTVTDAAQVAVVYALTAHAYELAGHLRASLETPELTAPLVPIARAILESSVTACWTAHNPEGATAIMREYGRQQENLSAALSKANTDAWREAAHRVTDRGVLKDDPTSSDGQAKHIEQRFRDLVGGEDLYVTYRVLSSLSHAGIAVVDLYAEEAPAGDAFPLGLRQTAKTLGEGWTIMAACALVWCARAMLYLAPDKTYRNQLRAIARDLGTSEQLRPSQAMHQRLRNAKRARRDRTP